MKEWRQYGPIGVLFDIIASICTPQTRELLQKLQQVEAESLGKTAVLKELVKPVKTRWNSYYAAFARAVELQGPLDNYVELKLDENRHTEAVARRSRRPGGPEPPVSLQLSLRAIVANNRCSNQGFSCARAASMPATGRRSTSIWSC